MAVKGARDDDGDDNGPTVEIFRQHDAGEPPAPGERGYSFCVPIDIVNFKGRNTLCLGGRLFMGPDLKYLAAVIVLATIPVCTFAWNSYDIFQEKMPGGIFWSFVPFLLYVVLMYNLLWAAMMDPGVIPRDNSPQAGRKGKREFVKEIDGVKYKWCRTCRIYRPPRSKHCPVCDNCVDKFDHHCPWVGNCIGRRNYIFFQWFIHTAFLLVIAGFILSYVQLSLYAHKNGKNLTEAMLDNGGTMVTLVVAFLGLLPVGGLSVYHAYLSIVNRSTNEDVNDVYKRIENPYDEGCYGNWKQVFCPAFVRPSKLLPAKPVKKSDDAAHASNMKSPTSTARERNLSSIDVSVNPMAGELGSPKSPNM